MAKLLINHDNERGDFYGVRNRRRIQEAKAMSLRDAIDNFYERLVVDAIDATLEESDTADYLTDVMCVPLNRLPARYRAIVLPTRDSGVKSTTTAR